MAVDKLEKGTVVNNILQDAWSQWKIFPESKASNNFAQEKVQNFAFTCLSMSNKGENLNGIEKLEELQNVTNRPQKHKNSA